MSLPNLHCSYLDTVSEINPKTCQSVVRDFVTYKNKCYYRQCGRSKSKNGGPWCSTHADLERDKKGSVETFEAFRKRQIKNLEPVPGDWKGKESDPEEATDALYKRMSLVSKSRDQQIADLEDRLSRNETDQDVVDTTLDNAERNLKTSQQEVQRLQKTLDRKEQELKVAQAATEQARGEHKTAASKHAEESKGHNQRIATLQKENEAQLKTIQELRLEIASLQNAEQSAAGESKTSLANARQETAVARAELKAAQETLKSLEKQLSEAKSQLASAKLDHGQEKTKLENAIQRAEDKEKALTKQLEKLQTDLESAQNKSSTSGTQVTQLQALSKKLEAENDKLKEQLRSLQDMVQIAAEHDEDKLQSEPEVESKEEQEANPVKPKKTKKREGTYTRKIKAITPAIKSEFKDFVLSWDDFLNGKPILGEEKIDSTDISKFWNRVVLETTTALAHDASRFMLEQWNPKTSEVQGKFISDNPASIPRKTLYEAALNTKPADRASFTKYLNGKVKTIAAFENEFEAWLKLPQDKWAILSGR